MKLSQLLKSVPGARMVSGHADQIEILDISVDSRKVRSGTLFAAMSGTKCDGHIFVSDAASRKASAVAVENAAFASSRVPSVVIPNMRRVLPVLSRTLFGSPSSQMEIVGITGTNGKTTVAFALNSILESAYGSCGLMGTVEYRIGGRRVPATLTTPEINDTSRMLRDMHDAGQKHCVMEVSSHALCADRVAGIDFRAAVFTNLSQDHLDFHENMENYYMAKKKLFEMLRGREEAFAVINIDDEFGRRLISEVDVPVITYSVHNRDADVSAVCVSSAPVGTRMKVRSGTEEFEVSCRLSGDFNVSNILAACACAVGLGIDSGKMAQGLTGLNGVDGRMDFLSSPAGTSVVVDYAHTPDALRVVLESLRSFGPERIITVFGCGGERDRTKRPVMGSIANELSDIVVLTNDNPRDEDPDEIICDILSGVKDIQKFRLEKDRRKAIELALSLAREKDIVLVAGKGHESYQVVGKRVLYFNDKQVCEEIISEKYCLRPVVK